MDKSLDRANKAAEDIPEHEIARMVSVIVRIALSNSQRNIPLKREEIIASLQTPQQVQKIYPMLIANARETLIEIVGLDLVELPAKKVLKSGAGSNLYVLKNVIPYEVRAGLVDQPADTPQYSILMFILTLIHVNNKELSEKELYASLQSLGIRKDTIYEDLMPKHTNAAFKIGKGGTLEHLFAIWIKAGYMEKQKTKDAEPVIMYSWGPRAKVEFGDDFVADFIAEVLAAALILAISGLGGRATKPIAHKHRKISGRNPLRVERRIFKKNLNMSNFLIRNAFRNIRQSHRCSPITMRPSSHGFHSSLIRSQGLPQQPVKTKEETQVEKAIRALREEQLQVSELHMPLKVSPLEPKLPLIQRIKNEALHYWQGLKLLGVEVRISSKLLLKVMRGIKLSRREQQQLRRTTGDLVRLVPFIIIALIPFLELLLPVLLALFPNMLPSTFESKYQKEEKRRKLLKVRLEVAKFLQETVSEMAVQGSSKTKNSAEFVEFFHKWRISGAQAPTEDIIRIAKKFEDQLTLSSLSRPQLVSMCKYMNINAFGTDPFLRQQINARLSDLKKDDRLISSEGVDSLTISELQAAAQTRGIRILGTSPARLRSELTQWIDLNLNQKIPSSLLILSRAFVISERIPSDTQEALKDSAQALQATLSSLPDYVVNEAALSLSEQEGTATYKQKLDVLKDQEELIGDELEQEEAQRQQAEKTRLEKIAATAGASSVGARNDPEHHAGTDIDVEHIEFPEDKVLDEDIEIDKREIRKIADALKTMTTQSALNDVKEKLEALKEDRKELKEDIEELEQVLQKKQASATDKLGSQLDKMLERIEEELGKYDSEIGSKLHILTPDHEGKLTLSELEDALKVIQANPDDERIKKIVKKLDTDGDGKLSILEISALGEIIDSEEGSGTVVSGGTSTSQGKAINEVNATTSSPIDSSKNNS